MFPSVLNTFNRPTPSDRLNSPSHSGLHNTVSSALGQVEAFIGRAGDSSTAGTLLYDVRSPDSNGGGHVQTAVKGGTGQTTYTKGDLLVASSPSVLTKLAIGADGTVLKSNSSMASGVEWSPGPGKIGASASTFTAVFATGVSQSSLMSATVLGSTLGTTNAVRGTLYISNYSGGNGGPTSVLLAANYGNGVVASVMFRAANNISGSVSGTIQYALIANNSATSQKAILNVNLFKFLSDPATASTIGVTMYNSNTSSINSSANQTFGITAMGGGSGDTAYFTVDGHTIEKIS